jgi:molybdate transport system permease protein
MASGGLHLNIDYHERRSLARLVLGASASIYVLFVGLPIFALLIRAVGVDGFLEGLTSLEALTALRLSLLSSAISMILVVLVGTPFAYLLARSKSRVIRVLDILVELPLVLPPVVAGLAMLIAFGRRGFIGRLLESMDVFIPFTLMAVIFAQVFVAAPFYIRSARIGFQSVRTDYEEIARTLGATTFGTFWRVTIPLSGSSLLGGFTLGWARAIAEFGATMMFAGNFPGRTRTMPLAILSALESDISVALSMAALLMLVSFGLLGVLGILRFAHGRPDW